MGWWGEVAGALLPDGCVACDVVLADGELGFCEACAGRVLEVPSGCRICGEPGPSTRCARCTLTDPQFSRAWAPFEHEGALARAIHRFKYEDRADLAGPLGRLVARHPAAKLEGCLVPIPLHPARFRERGFDQAALLAAAIGADAGRPVHYEWLRRERHTRRQVGLSEDAREENVRQAFSASDAVRGQRIVLVDDVYTTGATAREATRVLRAHGAAQVQVVTVARAAREAV